MDTNEIARLISDYLDGELTDDEAARLANLLEADDAAVGRFVLSSFIHSQLLDWMDRRRVNDRAVLAALAEAEEPPGAGVWPAAASPAESPSRRVSNSPDFVGAKGMRRRHLSWGVVAAALLVVASLSFVFYTVASRPVFVGQLTDATNCRWAASQADIPVGSFLVGGQELQLLEGKAVITFESGAKLLLEGPTSLRLDSTLQVHLLSGKIAAKVPRQAMGFTVTSSLARFIDLGTAFTLNLVAEKSFELHVFEGLVELWLDKRFGESAGQPARVAEVRAVTFDVASGDVANLEFQEGKQMPF